MKEAITSLAEELGINNIALLEQDVRLHRLLHHVTKNSIIADKLVFKGGTYLTKCHLNYPRFSVDLDFTWRQEDHWGDLGVNRIRDVTRPARNQWRKVLQDTADRFGYTFDPGKILWGSSSRMGTAHFGYVNSYGEPAIIKFQLNFVEPLLFNPIQVQAGSLISNSKSSVGRLYDDENLKVYQDQYPVTGYDIREVVAEKGRAILTRAVPKGRDVLDLYLIGRDLGIRIEDQRDHIETKLQFALGLGDKYRLNLSEAPARLKQLADDDVKPLTLKNIDYDAFEDYRVRLLDHMSTYLE